MKQGILIFSAITLLLSIPIGWTQQTQPSDSVDLAPGFRMRPTGGIDIGDIYAEVVQFGTDWKETEEHDVFKPNISTPDLSSHVVTGVFTSPSGSFNLTEHLTAIDGGIDFSATVKSEMDLPTNELSVAFTLPVSMVGGKQITVDGQPLTMPLEPAKKGEAHLFEKENVRQIDIPTPAGALTLTGNFSVLVQDDREWGDKRYALRARFSPGAGAIKESKIEIQMKLNPAGTQH